MEVTPDFKNTEIGCFPRDWNLIELSKISAFITKGSTPTTYGFNWESSGILFLRSECVSEDGMDLNQSKFISIKAHQALKRSEIKNGDILVTITGNVGRAIIYELDEEANINQHIARIRVSSDFVDKSYVYHFLSQKESISRFNSITTGQAYPQLSLKQVRDNLIATPKDVNEQKAIAEALSDADALIESLEKLIEKKRQIKQGAMQELLTGKKRLPGFSGELESHLLKSVTWYQEGPGVRNWQFTSSGIKLLNGTNIVNGVLNLDSTSRFISEQEAYGAYAHFMAENGDIVIASSGITVDKFDQKVAFVKAENLPFCMNTSTIRFKTYPKINANFLYHYLKSSDFKQQIGGQATGSAQLNFGPSHLDKITLQLPKVDEQIAIADVLTDLDSELTELDFKLNKARQIKQGMMQELLTGRIRLV